ncbi:RNA polymerase sigma factor [Chitinophaga qingshengii]|uniref:RNA polymerase sigma factor n=1 Tax=Chitinophaga qingshengii TaxID=1569794 RepID=A0ABR7TYB9_9BACT|nr:RNA polymerase sigma factor [Chitinophaga qingshengii]MBC9934134.1 RNA polymerase sigma factor [Chitinophaga qingshengii]
MKPENTYNNRIFAFLSEEEKRSEFKRLYDEHHGRIFKAILRMLGNGELVEDVLQETFENVWKNMDKYDADKASVYTWICNIARSEVGNVRRNKLYRSLLKNAALEDAHTNLVLTFDKEYTGINRLFNHLKPEHRILMEMVYYRDWKQEEIAQQLGLPLGTVKTRITKAREALRDIAKREYGY